MPANFDYIPTLARSTYRIIDQLGRLKNLDSNQLNKSVFCLKELERYNTNLLIMFVLEVVWSCVAGSWLSPDQTYLGLGLGVE